MNKKLLIGIIIVVILIVGGYFVFSQIAVVPVVNEQKNFLATVTATTTADDISNEQQNSLATTTVDTSNWLSYRNFKYGFKFKYPNDYTKIYDYDVNRIDPANTFGLKLQMAFIKNTGTDFIFAIADSSKIEPGLDDEFICNANIENDPADMGCPTYTVAKKFYVGSDKARIVNSTGEGGPTIIIDVFHEGLVLRFRAWTLNRDVSFFEDMAKTLRFLKPEEE